jgi:hypothetical protein
VPFSTPGTCCPLERSFRRRRAAIRGIFRVGQTAPSAFTRAFLLGGGFQYVPLEWNSGLHRTPVTHQEPRSQGETLLLV